MEVKKIRIRKSTKYFCIVIAIILIIASTMNIIKISGNEFIATKTEQIYVYKNKFNYNYKVNLLPNKYVGENNLNDKNFAYVTDLIDNIELNLDYLYEADKTSDINYEYEIVGKMQAYYSKDGLQKKVLEKEDVLLEKITKNDKTDKIKISDSVKLNLKEKNALLNEFKQSMGITVDAKYIVALKINIKTNIEGKDVIENYQPTVQIDLAQKTTEITGENNKEETQYVAKKYDEQVTNSGMLIIDFVCLGVAIYLLIYVNKAQIYNKIKNEFKQELNRILKLYQDKIVQVNTKPKFDPNNTVTVKDFGEIVKLSEELLKPILFYYSPDEEEALFSVMGNVLAYKYIIKK